MRRTIARIVNVPERRHGAGLTTADVGQDELGDLIDPFIVVSLYSMAGPTFPPHPHAGFSVATYILPESPIGFINQDSIGNRNRIAPGALHLTVAGSGVLHEEQPERAGSMARGYQIWMDHAASDREIPPHALHLSAQAVPVAMTGGTTIRVVMGGSNGLQSPLLPRTDVDLVDVSLAAGSEFGHELASGDHAFLFVLEGSANVGGHSVRSGHVAATSPGEELVVTGGSAGARLTLFAGSPFRHAGSQSGPFVANDLSQLTRFGEAYRSGRFGRLAPFSEQPDWAPSEGWN